MRKKVTACWNQHKKTFRGISLGWKLAAYVLVFLVLILLVVWIFQILLLDVFLENTKKEELQETAIRLSEKLGEEDLERQAMVYASERFMNISIYQISNGLAKPIVSVYTGGGEGHGLKSEQLSALYQKAKDNNGVYETKIAFGGKEIKDDKNDFLPSDPENYKDSKIHAKNIRLVHILLETDDAGNQYLLFLNTPLLPLDATVSTLKTQFFWITDIILILAAIMVILLYRKISKPLIRMNESAKQLALGKYDVTFSGKGYLETRELAQTLNYASCELSKLDRLQKELIANISHDLRTPLTMIRGYGEMMRDISEENTPENMQLIIDETERLSELVNDLLDLSKLQAGSKKPDLSIFDLTDLLSEVMERYEAFTKHQGYSVLWETDGSDISVLADRNMILQVVYNLINNAINYTGDDKRVWVCQNVKDQKVRISFTDTGNGIPQDQVELIWDRYYKLDKVHRRAAVGSGLGLSIVKEILDKHNAAYGVTSTMHVGSTFWFELPVVEQRTETPNIKTREEGQL